MRARQSQQDLLVRAAVLEHRLLWLAVIVYACFTLVSFFPVPSTATRFSTQPTDGFAGPVTSAPRPIDVDTTPASSAGLRQVRCAGPVSSGTRCWVASER